MENKQPEAIVVPKSFRLACQLFGIAVPDFLQLYVNHFSYMDQYFHDNSVYDLVTKSFDYVLPEKDDLNVELNEMDRARGAKLVQQQIKLSINRNYSYGQRRNKGKLLTNQLFDLCSKGCELKNVIYLDEETKISLNKDLLLMSLLTGFSVPQFLNSIMQCLTLPDYLARMHLDKGIYNPVVAVYIRVFDGFGNICDKEYQESKACRELIMEIQELNKRYFFCQDVEQRISFYQEWLDNYLENKISIY
ncbi:hypothetical protein ACFX5U_01785 [Sphingobacterium sp. SG20118]|uniref:hypothetical protein n=1 Tax=unclassified Sphingobacterium TaxID=2609468 RepID=UPI0004F82305|nr:hypothetical protein [Sphingobacterium sp. ML3W]AIM35808.1 hypothetical protein KO02_03290 [Sphingobacterium sp. ML3W]